MRAFILLIFSVFLYLSCSTDVVDGAGAETTNSIFGSAYYPNGSPAVGATVRLRTSSFLTNVMPRNYPNQRAINKNVIVDSNGGFKFDSIHTGSYAIEINDEDSMALLIDLEIADDSFMLELPADTLEEYAVASGKVDYPLGYTGDIYVQIYGLERTVIADSGTGTYKFDDLPSGEYTIRISTDLPQYSTVDVETPFLSPGTSKELDTALVIDLNQDNYSTWTYSTTLNLITDATGADIQEDLYRFPILVKLNDANFTFSQALPMGEDLRFSSSIDNHLFYEIEMWDTLNREAAIWVLVDTVFGNNNSQFINMYWGKFDAVPQSDGEKVFKTENDFAAVWHLNDSILDATGNNNDGTNNKSIRSTGLISGGRFFDGDSNYVSFGNDSSLSNISEEITVTGWFKTSQILGPTTSIIRHDNHFTALQLADDVHSVVWNPDLTHVGLWKEWNALVANDNWHHYCVTYNSMNGWQCYIDGALYLSDNSITGPLKTDGPYPFVIGATRKGEEGYIGSLDEIRVSKNIRSASWIKLNFENQKEGSSFVVVN